MAQLVAVQNHSERLTLVSFP